MKIQDILSAQKTFFQSQKTKNIDFRKNQLMILKNVIKKNENLFYEAIYKDFGKSKFDTFTTEISFLYNEIDFFIKNIKTLAKPKKVRTNLANLPGKSKIQQEPLGNTLVIGAWNYPIQLSLLPVICALAAGNTCILKPSEIAPHTSSIISKIIKENFQADYFYVFEGGIEETTEILKLKFDKIFFTGSTHIGKIVYKAAAEHLTPVTLELGGKSPVIVTKNANLEIAAKRIVWGKFLNAGQTCVAPDYLLIETSVKNKLLNLIKKYISLFNYTPTSEHYTRIINTKNFNRLIKLIDQEKVFIGGQYNEELLFIEPTILNNNTWEDLVMKDEIFGPILPTISFENYDEIIKKLVNLEKPLSAYLFTNNDEEKKKFTSTLSFGGGCINDVVMHLSNDNLPFGGAGNSGIGNYHGKFGFESFSHPKAILEKATWGEPNIKYPPYSETKLNLIKKVL